MTRMGILLGLDLGGSHTEALLTDESGVEVGRGSAPPGSLATQPEERALDAVRAAVAQAAALASARHAQPDITSVCAGVAGYSLQDRRDRFATGLAALFPGSAIRVEPDYVTAFWGASAGDPGIVIIAGTGATAYGCNSEGRCYREDGLGYLLGDRGSGFHLGLKGLRHTLNALKAGAPDRLARAVLDETGAGSEATILQWLYGDFKPYRVAALAPKIGWLAEEGDPEACSLVAATACELRHSVREVRHHLDLPRDAPVYTLGGLWKLGLFFRSEFEQPSWNRPDSGSERETLEGARLNVCAPRSDAVHGAALLARRAGNL